MTYQAFPRSTVIYNVSALSGILVLGGVVAAQIGLWFVVGYTLLILVSVAGVLSTVCARCSYYGHRCGLGLGWVVARLFGRRPGEAYFRTPMQFVYLGLLLVGLAWPLVGSARLLAQGYNVARLVELVAVVGLLLALAVPHPRLVCRHCRQGACGACPVGRMVRGTDQ